MLELGAQLEAAFRAGQTLVVPTAQRAAALRLAFAKQQIGAGHRAFRTPDAQSLTGWLRGQQTRLTPDARAPRRLGASEEWLLWREVVTQAAARLSLPEVSGLVDAVRRSAAVVFEWRIEPSALLQFDTPEAVLLGESLSEMDARLRDLCAVASWRALADLALDPPKRPPVFAGFASVTPARRELLAAWAQRGTAVQEPGRDFSAGAAAVTYAADPQDELARIAHWCEERLRMEPSARLLVVVPDLARRRMQVRRVFDAALDPGYLQRGATDPAAAYALEGGQSLLSFAPAATGVRTLQLLSSEVEFAAASQWLRDCFWVRPDAAHRARLDVWLRSVLPPRLNAGQLLQALRSASPALQVHADEVAATLARLMEVFAAGSPAPLGVWSGRFARVFALCGLTAGAARQRGSHSQQVLQRLDELLQECALLPPALGAWGAAEAVTTFTQLLRRTRFEPATGDVAVTLTDSFADPILRYDGIWVSGCHSAAIPQRPHFDPFIPASLQRQAGVSNTDAAALVRDAQQALAALCQCSREFIVSAPGHSEDLELAPSPLLAPYAARVWAPPHPYRDVLPRVIREARQVETYADEPGALWSEALPLPAGTRAIELQSRCPFRAYAQLRLGAEPLEAPVPGITPRERGRMLHRALQLLWQGLAGSAGLAAARSAESLSGLISADVSQAADEILRGTDPDATADDSLGAAADVAGLRELRRAAITRELGRAERLLGALCELEAGRTPFVVQELEAEHRLQIGGALINVRIDRIDRLADGSHAILDYKSGRAVTPDWEVARTTHPQLLVYLLAAGMPVSALVVAHLDPKAVVLKGVADVDNRLPGVKGVGPAPQAPDEAATLWTRQREIWRDQVAKLAGAFVSGHASVEPVDKACDYCHLHAFCRIADQAEDGAEVEGDGDVDCSADAGELQ